MTIGDGSDSRDANACSKCGTKNPENAKYCYRCGQPLLKERIDETEMAQTSLRARGSSSRARSFYLVAGGVMAIIALSVIVLALISNSNTGVGPHAPESSARSVSTAAAASRTLPSIQPPPTLSENDFFSAQAVYSTATGMLEQAATLDDLIGRYPSWNAEDQYQFEVRCSMIRDQSGIYLGMNRFRPSARLEKQYGFWESWQKALVQYQQCGPMLLNAFQTRNATEWKTARDLFDSANRLASAAATTAEMLYNYGAKGNVDYNQ